MTVFVRQIYEDMPSVLTVPVALQHKRVEVILLSLDEMEAAKPEVAVDENGWPIGLFEKLTNSWQGQPMIRGYQGEDPTRLAFK